MARTQRSAQFFVLLLIWSFGWPPTVSGQKKIECSSAILNGAFSADVDLKILITGFGYPDDRADLFGNRYAVTLQSLVTAPKDSGTSSTHAAHTLKGRIIRYLPCDVTSHSAARQLGQQVGADVVLWGLVQWRNWQGGGTQTAPNVTANDISSASAQHATVSNAFNGSIGQVQQNFISLAGTTTAMVTPYLTAVQFAGLEAESDHPIQFSDNKELNKESYDTLLASPHLALIHFLLGRYASDHRDDEVASQHYKLFVDYMGGFHLNLISKAKDAVTLLDQTASSFIRNKSYGDAVPFLQRAIERCDSLDIHCLAEENYSLGEAYRRNGSRDEAISQYEKSLELWKRTQRKEKIAEAYLALGKLYQDKDEYEDAIYHVRQHIMIGEKIGESYQPRLAEGYLSLGELYNLSEQYKKSIQPLNLAVKIFHKLGSEYISYFAQTNQALGESYSNQQDYVNALGYYQEALTALKKINSKRRIAEVLDDIALTWDHLGDLQEATNNYEAAAIYYQGLNPPVYAAARSSLTQALTLCNQRLPKNPFCGQTIQKKLATLPH